MDILVTGFCGTSSETLVKKSKYKSLLLPNDKHVDSQIFLEEIMRERLFVMRYTGTDCTIFAAKIQIQR